MKPPLKALDTNVLVRYLTADEPRQTKLAEYVIEQSRMSRQPLFLSVLVLCETAWVLDRCYSQSKAAVLDVLERLLEADVFEIEADDVVRRSITDYRAGKGDFADYLIGNIGHHAGCSVTLTFDRALAHSSKFSLLR